MCGVVPGAPPQEVSGSALSSTSIEVNWRPPPPEHQNGDITAYKVVYNKVDQDAETIEVGADERSYILQALSKYTEYEISIVACTVVGDGPPSDTMTIRTAEDGMYDSVCGPCFILKACWQ